MIPLPANPRGSLSSSSIFNFILYKINPDILVTREQQTNNATQYDKMITTMKNNKK